MVKTTKMMKAAVKAKAAKVVVVMGSRSDLPVMKAATELLESWDVPVETQIVSAHRTPDLLEKSVRQWEGQGVAVIIAGAGGAAHLPGMLASFSRLPVIGVPIRGKAMNGLDSLLSIAQMPRGVPVATVAVDNATNAGLLAAQILATSDSRLGQSLTRQLVQHKRKMGRQVGQDRKKLGKLGIGRFLKTEH